ncbi:MAG: hypothetical protein NZO16_07525 [Deltaproteobacteria bacterium]|nr:hypothetical protein [Deltaproteobacteria bacterium]
MVFINILIYVVWFMPAVVTLLTFIASLFRMSTKGNITSMNFENFILAFLASLACLGIDRYLTPTLRETFSHIDPFIVDFIRLLYIILGFAIGLIVMKIFKWR